MTYMSIRTVHVESSLRADDMPWRNSRIQLEQSICLHRLYCARYYTAVLRSIPDRNVVQYRSVNRLKAGLLVGPSAISRAVLLCCIVRCTIPHIHHAHHTTPICRVDTHVCVCSFHRRVCARTAWCLDHSMYLVYMCTISINTHCITSSTSKKDHFSIPV